MSVHSKHASKLAIQMLFLLTVSPVFAADYVLETSIVTDWETISYYGSQEEAQKAIDEAITYADTLLAQQLNIDMEVTHIDMPLTASDDTIANHSNPSALMDSVYVYVVNDQDHRNADLTVFFTTRILSSGSNEYVGWANIASICRSDSIVIIRLYNNGLDGQTLTHEIAHVLGAVHDGDAPCEATPIRGYLMAAATHNGTDNLSQCSIDTIITKIETSGSCLTEDNTSPPPVIAPPVIESRPAQRDGSGSVSIIFIFVLILLIVVLNRERK